MLKIVTGPAGSGKTTFTLNVLQNFAESGNNKLLLIVPEQFSFASERNVLRTLSTKDAQNIEVLSFTRLPDYVNRSLGGLSGVSADSGAKIIIMLRALESVQDNIEFYARHINSVALVKELISLVTEFKRELVTPSMLEEAAKKTELKTFSMKLHELALIYDAYNALLEKEFAGSDALTDRLCNVLKTNKFFAGYTICIDAFKGFTAEELMILKCLILQADDVYITLSTSGIYANDPSMIFDAVNDTAKRIIRMAKDESIPVKVLEPSESGIKRGRRFKSGALKFLEENIFYPTENSFEGESCNDIVLCTASTLHEECNYVAATARRLMRESNIRLNEMAVIARNEDLYKRELLDAFSKYEIPVFEDNRQPIMHQPIVSICKAILTIMTSGFTTENILNYLKTGLSPLDEEEAARLENYALMWNLSSKDWYNDFTLNPDGMNAGIDERSKKELDELNGMRIKVIVPLRTLKKNLSQDDTVTTAKICESLYDFIIKTNVKDCLKKLAVNFNDNGYAFLANEQDRVWELFMNTLDKLSSVYGDSRTTIKTYFNLFCAVLSVTDLGSIPHGLDEITIGSADRIRLSDVKVVFVVGCAEGVFPASIKVGGLLTSTDRSNLQTLGIELSSSNTLMASEERFIAYSALCSSSQKLYITYHRTESANENLLPSSIYNGVSQLFENKVVELDASLLPAEYYAETESSLFSTYSALYAQYERSSNGNKLNEKLLSELATLRKVLEVQGKYKDKLLALDKISRKEPFRIYDSEIATKLFGKDMFLSASRVDLYHHCAFEYFCQYGLSVHPREKAELNPAVSGTVIHYVLEHIIAENGKDGLLSMTTAERKSAIEMWLTTYLNETIGGFDDKTKRFTYLYNRLAFSLYDVVDRLCNEFASSDFVPCDFELPIGNAEEGIESYTLSLPDGAEVRIKGSVDRVDKYEKDGKTYIRVVDYKSGGKDFVLSDILEGLNMQMLIYLFAIWSGGKDRYGNVVPGGVLYYPAKRNTISMTSKDMSKDEIEDKKRKDDQGNGLFLLDDDMLEAMEHGKANKFISITDSHGNLKDNLITLESMGLLKKKIDTVLSDMSQSLHKGYIKVLPVTGKNYDNTCKYCNYAAVCGFEDGEGKEIIKIDNAKVIEMLEKDGAENE